MGTALIWGASGGIGRALVARLVDAGHSVVAISRDTDDLQGLTAHVFQADPADEFAVRQAVLAAAQEFDQVDLLIYAAGDILAAKTREMQDSDLLRIFNANLIGAILTTMHSLPLLATDAYIIYLGAVHQRLQLPGYGAYAASKAALDTFAAVLAKEERQRRIAVIRPAAVETPLWEKVPLRLPAGALSPDALAEQILALIKDGATGVIDIPG